MFFFFFSKKQNSFTGCACINDECLTGLKCENQLCVKEECKPATGGCECLTGQCFTPFVCHETDRCVAQTEVETEGIELSSAAAVNRNVLALLSSTLWSWTWCQTSGEALPALYSLPIDVEECRVGGDIGGIVILMPVDGVADVIPDGTPAPTSPPVATPSTAATTAASTTAGATTAPSTGVTTAAGTTASSSVDRIVSQLDTFGASVSLNQIAPDGTRGSITTTVAVKHTRDGITVQFDVKNDDDFQVSGFASGARPYQYDSVEILIDADRSRTTPFSGDDRQLFAVPTFDSVYTGNGVVVAGASVSTSMQTSGYVLLVTLPYSLLRNDNNNNTPFAADTQLGINFVVNNKIGATAQANQVFWKYVANHYNDASQFPILEIKG